LLVVVCVSVVVCLVGGAVVVVVVLLVPPVVVSVELPVPLVSGGVVVVVEVVAPGTVSVVFVVVVWVLLVLVLGRELLLVLAGGVETSVSWLQPTIPSTLSVRTAPSKPNRLFISIFSLSYPVEPVRIATDRREKTLFCSSGYSRKGETGTAF